jgi:cell division topological specificity factor
MMSLLGFLKRQDSSAPAARERLQVLLAHERASVGRSDLVGVLREEILAVIAKHVAIDRDKVQVKMDHRDAVSMLAVDIELPLPVEKKVA